jgi:superfamily II DNA or RNA helicase
LKEVSAEKDKIQQEAIAALEKSNFNGIFILPTGAGKSRVVIECLKKLQKLYNYNNIWYLCNSTDLRDRDFVKELEDWGAADLIPKIKRMCYQTAYKIENEHIDIVIADEFDYSLSPEYSRVYYNNIFKHKLFTTAFIDKDKMKYVEELKIPIVYKKTLQEVEDKEVLNKSRYYFVNFLMSDQESKDYIRFNDRIAHLMNEKTVHALSGNKSQLRHVNYKIELATRARKRFLNALESSAHYCRKLMAEIYKEDKACKILTFCELTKQADAVCKYTYHDKSDPENLKKFREDQIQALAVCGKINRGVNIKGIKYVIFESCNQSKTQLIQRLGRGKRLKSNEVLNVYFLIPCYQENGKMKFTKIRDWIVNAAGNLDLSEAKLYRFKS